MKRVLRFIERWFLFGVVDTNWPLVPFQPILFVSVFVATVLLFVVGDDWSSSTITRETVGGFAYVWEVNALLAPPMLFISIWLLEKARARWQYRGLWLRFSADLMMSVALSDYSIWRITHDDFHIVLIAIMLAATLFTFSSLIRDVRTLVHVERIANHIVNGDTPNASE